MAEYIVCNSYNTIFRRMSASTVTGCFYMNCSNSSCTCFRLPTVMESLFSTILEDTSIAGQPIESTSTRLRRLVQEQIDCYRAEHADINVNPLKWWKDHEHRFNFLSPVAKQLMAVMGTSVPSERLFSAAGNLISAKRSCLSSKNVDMLLFLNKNWPYM